MISVEPTSSISLWILGLYQTQRIPMTDMPDRERLIQEFTKDLDTLLAGLEAWSAARAQAIPVGDLSD